MPDIKVYRRIKDEPVNPSPEETVEDDNYLDKIKRHRIKMYILWVFIIILGICFMYYFSALINNRTYSGYTIINSVTRDEIQDALYYSYKDGFIRCSKDGISYYNKKGVVIWNQTFQMKAPQVKICSNEIAVADINGSVLFVFNEKGLVTSVDTSLSISQVEVAKNGMAAVVLEDATANYINMYDNTGQKVYSVKTTLAGDGYPLDISISEDATKLIASFVYVSGESIKTNVVFYNFSSVGQNETERVVGGFNHYESTLVPDVNFMTDTCAVAVGEDILTIYKIKEFPSLSKEIKIDSSIKRVFFSDKYIGMILENKESGDNYKLRVYDTSGNNVSEISFNTDFSDIKFDKDTIILSNSKVFKLYSIKGKELASLESDLPLEKILGVQVKGNYMMVNSTYVQEIRLK